MTDDTVDHDSGAGGGTSGTDPSIDRLEARLKERLVESPASMETRDFVRYLTGMLGQEATSRFERLLVSNRSARRQLKVARDFVRHRQQPSSSSLRIASEDTEFVKALDAEWSVLQQERYEAQAGVRTWWAQHSLDTIRAQASVGILRAREALTAFREFGSRLKYTVELCEPAEVRGRDVIRDSAIDEIDLVAGIIEEEVEAPFGDEPNDDLLNIYEISVARQEDMLKVNRASELVVVQAELTAEGALVVRLAPASIEGYLFPDLIPKRIRGRPTKGPRPSHHFHLLLRLPPVDDRSEPGEWEIDSRPLDNLTETWTVPGIGNLLGLDARQLPPDCIRIISTS